jgi:hypothetical protein
MESPPEWANSTTHSGRACRISAVAAAANISKNRAAALGFNLIPAAESRFQLPNGWVDRDGGGVQGSPTLNGNSLPAGTPSSAIDSNMATVT